MIDTTESSTKLPPGRGDSAAQVPSTHKDSGAVSEARVLQFLREIKEANPMSKDIELHALEWLHDYPDFEQLMTHAYDEGLIDAVPCQNTGKDEAGHWYFWVITLRPKLFKILKNESQGARRQVMIEGREIDLRNRANFDLLHARIEDVENVGESYLHQLRNKHTKNQRRACMCQLHRLLLLRGPQLRRDLFGSICLRLGAALPADFWHLPDVGKTCSTPSFPLDPEEKR